MGNAERYKKRQKRFDQIKINKKLKKKFVNLFYPCYYCRIVFLKSDLTVEHIIPLYFGGTNEMSNITLACDPCNKKRGRDAVLFKRAGNLLKDWK